MDFKISNKKDFFYPACLTLIIFAVFFTSIHYPFLKGFDDNAYVLYNKHLSPSLLNILYWFTHSRVGCYLPLTMFSYMFDYNLWGFDSFGYHLQNIFWHIVAVITIYKCFRLFEIKSWIAFFICLIFAIHPQRVESVVWLSERKDVLCAAFYFLCIYSYIKHYDKKFSITAFVFFILSILSKSMAVSLPVILLIYEFYRCNKDKRLDGNTKSACRDTRRVSETCNAQATVIRHAPRVSTERSSTSRSTKIGGCKSRLIRLCPYFIILLIFIPVAIIAQGEAVNSQSQVLSFHRLYVILYNTYWYFAQTVFPIELNPIYPLIQPFYSIIEISLFYISFLLIAVVLFFRKKKLLIYITLPLVLAYIISLLPVVGLIKLGSTDHADRYSYIPSVFIWFSIGLILTSILYKKISGDSLQPMGSSLVNKKFIFIILTIYTSILFFSTYQYQKIWENEHTLYSYAANIYPRNTLSLVYLANIELKRKNYGKVLGLAEELNLSTENSLFGYYYKAAVLFHTNRKASIQLLLFIKPHLKLRYIYKSYYKKTLKMLIEHYFSIGEKQETIQYINELLHEQTLGEFDQVYFQGVKAYCKKDYMAAIHWLEKAQKLQPGNKNVQNNIRACRLITGEEKLRSMKYTSRAEQQAISWQKELRAKLVRLLKIDDLVSSKTLIPFHPKTFFVEKREKYIIQEMKINSTSSRRINIVLTLPTNFKGPLPAVVVIGGHGTTRHSCYKSDYGYSSFANALAEKGYVTISTRVSQHKVYEKGRTLVGERLWDIMRCVDFLASLEEVDAQRIGCAGLSLGGGMAMWLGGMDERVQATVSSGFLTKMDQMEKNHCMCWKFPGLRELVDFSDIYSLIAPRALLCQNDLQEAYSQFPVSIVRKAIREIEQIYTDFGKSENLVFVAHKGGHVIDLPSLLMFFGTHLDSPNTQSGILKGADKSLRRSSRSESIPDPK